MWLRPIQQTHVETAADATAGTTAGTTAAATADATADTTADTTADATADATADTAAATTADATADMAAADTTADTTAMLVLRAVSKKPEGMDTAKDIDNDTAQMIMKIPLINDLPESDADTNATGRCTNNSRYCMNRGMLFITPHTPHTEYRSRAGWRGHRVDEWTTCRWGDTV